MKILKTEFFERETLRVAKELLGKKIVRRLSNRLIIATIAETECYTHEDPASHCFIGKTRRNSSMFGPVGHAYVYLSYGIHYCFNIVARDLSTPAGGVLIRSIVLQDLKKISGPGNVTKALSIDKSYDSLCLFSPASQMYILDAPSISEDKILITPRIGISKAIDFPWRFVLK